MLTGIRNFSGFLACWCILSAPAAAARLDDAACEALKVERARIETDALKSDMQKGPVWAKDNLTPERLKEVEQVIGLEESIAFRCQQPKSIAVPIHAAKTNSGAAGAGAAPSDAGAASAPVDEEAAVAPVPTGKKKKTAGAKKSAASTAESPETLLVEKPAGDKPKAKANKAASQKPAVKLQKSKSKAADAKPVDAFVPPAASAVQNPPVAAGESSAERPGAALAP